mgnify:CR=1 FL=1
MKIKCNSITISQIGEKQSFTNEREYEIKYNFLGYIEVLIKTQLALNLSLNINAIFYKFKKLLIIYY